MIRSTAMAIASLLTQAGQAHHEYEQTVLKGVYDKEWPIWYAQYAVEHGLNGLLNKALTPEQLGQFLGQIDEQYGLETPPKSWAEYTAEKMVQELIAV